MIEASHNVESLIQQTSQLVRQRLQGRVPQIALILGSGLSSFADHVEQPLVVPYSDLPGFPQPVVGGHRGELVSGFFGSTSVLVLRGRSHYYEHGQADIMRIPIGILKEIGCQLVLLTNAAGSMDPESPPGSLMLLEDTINLTGISPLFGIAGDQRFVNMTQALDPELNLQLEALAQQLQIPLRRGVYAWMAGPQFETPAEIRMLMTLGAHCVGMSTVPEIILARYYGLKVMALSIITNQAAGLSTEHISHTHTFEQAAMAGPRLEKLLRAFLQNYTEPS